MENFKKIDFISMYYKYINEYLPQIKLSSKRILSDVETFLKNTDSPFLSDNFKEELLKMTKIKLYEYTYILNLNQGPVHFHFISNKNLKSINKLKKYYFFVIFLRLNYNNSYKTLPFTNNVYINIVTVNTPKKILVPVSVDCINSASTIIYNNHYGEAITIWREDEIEKVLVHEALHSIHYDFDIIHQQLIPELKHLEQIIDKEGKGLNVNEAYNELGTIFIMSLFALGKKEVDKKRAKKIVKDVLLKELKHSLKNCGMLMSKYGIDNVEKCTFINNLNDCNYYQTASAYSYIVIKTALLWSLLNNCKCKGKHTDKFKCIEDFVSLGFWGSIGKSYQNLVVKIMENKEFNKIINKEIRKYKNKKGRPETLYFTIFH